MKYIYGLLVLIYGLNISAQQTQIITGHDHYFSPDTAFVNVGDTVRLVSLGYYRTRFYWLGKQCIYR